MRVRKWRTPIKMKGDDYEHARDKSKGGCYDTLVLSGNSTNAIVTLGALQYLTDNGHIKHIKNYIGTSSGAILSLLLIIGYQPIEILTYLCIEKVYKKMVQFNISNMLLMGKPLMSFEPIKSSLEQLVVEKLGFMPTMKSVELLGCGGGDPKKRLVFTTYNLTDDCREYITSETHPDLPVIHGIRMSSNFPLVFEPYMYEGKAYLDGGLVDNFAIEYGERVGNRCLGVMTNNPQRKYSPHDFGNIEFVWKVFQIFITTVTKDKIDRTNCDIVRLDFKSNFFNFDSSNNELIEMFDRGYELCKGSPLWNNEIGVGRSDTANEEDEEQHRE
jgi:predicted acylesterase/phospholipase RssA